MAAADASAGGEGGCGLGLPGVTRRPESAASMGQSSQAMSVFATKIAEVLNAAIGHWNSEGNKGGRPYIFQSRGKSNRKIFVCTKIAKKIQQFNIHYVPR
jgi:hypothetical protein